VTVSVEKGKRLGLVIRGGSEYGLGIFISGVDKGSLSDQSGLSIGDQILSVNGIDFRHITHVDAVQLLRNIDKMSFHLRQINKLPKPKNDIKNLNLKSIKTSPRLYPRIINKTKSQFDLPSTYENNIINSKINFFQLIIDKDDQIKIKYLINQYQLDQIHIDQLIKTLLNILNKQYQQYRNEIIETMRKIIRPNDLDRFDINIIKDDLSTLKLSHERLLQTSLTPSRISFHSPTVNMSKSVENLSIENDQRLMRPKSLLLDEQIKKSFDEYSPKIQRKYSTENKNFSMNSLRKRKCLHHVDKNEKYFTLNP
ncbi:unnamed protein product, partial [Rotaria sp. Silwood2]